MFCFLFFWVLLFTQAYREHHGEDEQNVEDEEREREEEMEAQREFRERQKYEMQATQMSHQNALAGSQIRNSAQGRTPNFNPNYQQRSFNHWMAPWQIHNTMYI